uniref:Putative nucleotide-binding alpha-beta plait domain-containing protein n=1 Tax=Tanacetum cinerariifolium TaxID=118510 RepID=A0A6L2NQ29_TANCI|nr:putative nucleotide-binding alpha-beta plait domain-containing protein [Tanacetum cinerariifolium]
MTTGKNKVESTPKLNIPGSANRLKMKEKDMPSNVFSKFSGKYAMAGKWTEIGAFNLNVAVIEIGRLAT